jgi:GDP-L-fucose synthase
MKVLITGGNGYIASSLYEALSKEHDTTKISRKDFDLTSFEDTKCFFENKYFDVVVHCAISGVNRIVNGDVEILDNNLKMYYNLLSNRSHYDKFINFGSGAERSSPDSFYGKSKSIISESIKYKTNFYNIIVYAVFDENELDKRFIKANLLRYINREPMMVSSDRKMTFFYMEDLIKLVNHIIDTDQKKLFHLNWASYTQDHSLLEIANMINNLEDYKVDIYLSDKKEIDYVSEFNAGYLLNYVGLKEGILRTYNAIKNEN